MIAAWRWFAAILLVVALIVHVSTFFEFDPLAAWPGVMFLHVAIFPPFIAAIWYASRFPEAKSKNLDPVFESAPWWLRSLTVALLAYAILNFVVFMHLNEGGGPIMRDGNYLLTSHGKVIRELTEAEYHRQQAYEVRGFSGHWMLFACASWTLLVGSERLRIRAG